MNVLSIHSEVVYGRVGLKAVRFALERLGHEVWAMPTVLLSNHTGYSHVEGETLGASLLAKLASGLAANGWLGSCDAVLSGYLGSAEQADVVADLVRQVKRANANALYCLDPVFGDDGRAYAKPGVAEAMARRLLPLADMVTPNAFELASLAGVPVRDATEALVAARRLGRPLVVATSVPLDGNRLGTLAVNSREAWLASHPRLDNAPHGAGDLFAALFLSSWLEGSALRDTLERATVSVFHVLERSVEQNAKEMLLLPEQENLNRVPALTDIKVEHLE